MANQSISFDLSTLPAKTFGDSPFDISSYASASSGLPVSFTSATPAICTVSGGTVKIVTSGTCTINANQAGNLNYNPAPQVQQSVIITDSTPPTTTASAVKADNTAYSFGSWTNQSVTVTLAATDIGGSGLASTFYTLDGTQHTYSTPFSISTEGSHALTFWSTDNAGNIETVQSVSVLIDLTGPSISGAATTSPNGNGWFNGAVTIHWTCSDALSGIASCPSDQTISTEGASQTLSGTAVDNAGNSTTVNSSAVNIDLTAPTISGAPTTSPNSNGWYNSAVTIHWTCSDALSGIASCPSDQTISTEGASQTVSGTATDNAGNSTTVSSSPAVSIDLTNPVVSYSGNAGTYSVDQTVTITCTATDNLSGVASTTCQNINAPAYTFAVGSNTVSTSATDNAGNVGTGSVTFTITVDSNSLTRLTQQFETNPLIARQLNSALTGVAWAEAINNPTMKANFINTYIMEVNLQRGRTLTNQQADILIQLAQSL